MDITRVSWNTSAANRIVWSMAALLVGSGSTAFADSFNLKPGAWEITSTPTASGPMIPPDVLAKMSPQQRAKLEQMQTAKPKPLVSQECITKADLDQNRILKGDDEDEAAQCTMKVSTQSPKKLAYEQTCSKPRSFIQQVTIEAPSNERLVGSIDRTSGPTKTHVDMTGRWLGASCADIKD